MSIKRSTILFVTTLSLALGIAPLAGHTALADESDSPIGMAVEAEAGEESSDNESKGLPDDSSLSVSGDENAVGANAADAISSDEDTEEGTASAPTDDVALEEDVAEEDAESDSDTAAIGLFMPAEASWNNVSGTINASDYEDGDKLLLESDTTLNMDVPRTFGFIACSTAAGNGIATFDLTVTGSNTFKVVNTTGRGLEVKSFSCAGDVDIESASEGIFAKSGNVSIGGNATVSSANNDCVSAPSGSVTIGGNANLTSTGDSGIDCSSGVSIGGNAVLECKSYGINCWDGSVSVGGTTQITSSNGYGVFGMFGFTAGGDVTVDANGNGVYVPKGAIDITGDVSITSGSAGITAANGIDIEGDTSVDAGGAGVTCWYGSISIDGDLAVDAAGGNAVFTNHSVAITGDADLTSPTCGIYTGEANSSKSLTIGGNAKITVTGETGSNSKGCGIYAGVGTLEIGGSLEISSSNYGIYAWNAKVVVGGSADVTSTNSSGIYCSGGFDGGGNTTISAKTYGIYTWNGMIEVDGDVTVTSGESGITAANGFSIAGDVTVDSGNTSVNTWGGSVRIDGNLTATTANGYTVFTTKSVIIGGNVDLTGVTYGIYAKDSKAADVVTIGGDAKITVSGEGSTSSGNGIFTLAGTVEIDGDVDFDTYHSGFNCPAAPVTVGGDVKIVSEKGYGVYCSKAFTAGGDVDITSYNNGIHNWDSNDGSVTIEGTTKITSENGSGVYCPKNFKAGGDVEITSKSSGIYTYNGFVDVDGNVTIKAQAQGIFAHDGAEITGNVDITSSDDGINTNGAGSSCSLIVGGTTTIVSSNGQGISTGVGLLELDGDVDITSHGNGIYSWGNKVMIDGNLDVENTSDTGMCINYVNSTGDFTVTGNVDAKANRGTALQCIYGLTVEGDVTVSTQGSGVFVPNGKATIGGNLTATCSGNQSGPGFTVKGDTSITASGDYGILCTGGLVDLYGDVDITGTRYGIEAVSTAGGVTFHGGTVTVKATADNAYEAILCLGTATLDGDITLTGGQYGIFVPRQSSGSGTVVCKAGRIEASGTQFGILAAALTIEDPLEIIDPSDGVVGTTTVSAGSSTTTYYTIQNGDGVDQKHTVIVEPHHVSFDANGGFGEMETAKVYHGDSFELPENGFKPAQCTQFDGWDAGAVGDSITVTADVTVAAQWKPAHTLEAVAGTPATCEDEGFEDYWECSACGKLFSDENGENEIEEPVAISATGHDWGEWEIVTEPTAAKTGLRRHVCKNDSSHVETEVIPCVGEISYSFSKGDGATWTKGSASGLEFIVNRSEDDDTTFSHYVSMSVDGTVLAGGDFEASSGSLNVTLSASFLETLEAGEHTIEATFDDGKAQASFTVENASTSEPEPEPKPEPAPGEDPKDEKKPATPKSGDATSVEAIVSVAMTASAMLGGAVVLRRKEDDSR